MIARLIIWRQRLIRLLEWAVILLFALLVLDVLWGVLSRASGGFVAWMLERGRQPWALLPSGQTRWTEEVAIYLMMWISLLGAAVAYGLKAHLGVDYFVGKLDPGAQRIAEGVAHGMAAFFALTVLIGGGYVLVGETLAAGQRTPALQMKVGYLYMAVPISGLFILMFAIEYLVELFTGKSSATAEG